MIRSALSASAKDVHVGFAASQLIVVFRETKVLPSACASVRALAGSPAPVETYTSIPRFPSSRFDQESRGPLANQFRWLLWKSEHAVFGN